MGNYKKCFQKGHLIWVAGSESGTEDEGRRMTKMRFGEVSDIVTVSRNVRMYTLTE